MDHVIITSELIRSIKSKVDPEFKEKHEQSILVNATNILGVRTSILRDLSKQLYNTLKSEPLEDIIALCDEIMATGIYEMRALAFDLIYLFKKKFEKRHFVVFEGWVKNRIEEWSDCDSLCNHTVGDMIMLFPDLLEQILPWTKSKKWVVRRASAVSLVIPARRGLFLQEVFAIAEELLDDEHDLVLKGYGWMLKEASKKHPQEVFDFIVQRKKTMPRVALRYAVEKLNGAMREEAMARYN